MASWWSADDESADTFTNTTYAEKHTLDFTAPAQGDYLIVVTGEYGHQSINNSIGIRAQLDDTTTFLEILAEGGTIVSPYEYAPFGTFYLAESLASGAHNVDIDAYVEGDTGQLRNLRIVVLRLDDWLDTTGMYDSAAAEGETSITGSWATKTTLTFTPDVGGDYLVLGTCAWTSGSTTKTASVRLNYDSASEYLPIQSTEGGTDCFLARECKDGTDYLQHFWGGIVNIPASSKTILLECVSEGAGDIKFARIIAIRIAAMDSSPTTDEDVSETSTTSTSFQDKSVITFTPSSTEDYLIIGGWSAFGEGNSPERRFQQTAGTGSPKEIQNEHYVQKEISAPDDSLAHTSFFIKSLANVSQTFKTQYKGDGSNNSYIRNSFLVAIRKPAVGPETKSVTKYSNARIKVEGDSVTKNSDARIKVEGDSVTKTSDARIKSTEEVTKNSDARIKVEGLEVTKNSDARIKVEEQSVTKTSDARIVLTEEVTKTSDARIHSTEEVTKNSDARIKREGISVTKNSDARIKTEGSEVTKTSDARILVEQTVTKTSDARIFKEGISVTKNSDARIVYTDEVTKTSDARILNTLDVTKNSDARIKRLGLSVTKNSDARIVYTDEVTKTSDARIKREGIEVTKTSDARIKDTLEVTKNSDARIVLTEEVTKTSDARILVEQSITKNSDARIYKLGIEVTKNSDARIKKIIEVTKNSDARIKREGLEITKTSDARILKTGEVTKTSDALIKLVKSVTKTSDAYIIGTMQITKTCDARIVTSLQGLKVFKTADAAIMPYDWPPTEEVYRGRDTEEETILRGRDTYQDDVLHGRLMR